MMRSRVKENTMLFVLIFSLTAGFCSAKDNKPPDTKVTIYIRYCHYKFFLLQLNNVSLWRKLGMTYYMLI